MLSWASNTIVNLTTHISGCVEIQIISNAVCPFCMQSEGGKKSKTFCIEKVQKLIKQLHLANIRINPAGRNPVAKESITETWTEKKKMQKDALHCMKRVGWE